MARLPACRAGGFGRQAAAWRRFAQAGGGTRPPCGGRRARISPAF